MDERKMIDDKEFSQEFTDGCRDLCTSMQALATAQLAKLNGRDEPSYSEATYRELARGRDVPPYDGGKSAIKFWQYQKSYWVAQAQAVRERGSLLEPEESRALAESMVEQYL